MRLIPPIRTRRWIWLAVTILLAAAWVGSARESLDYFTGSIPTLGVGLNRGCFLLAWIKGASSFQGYRSWEVHEYMDTSFVASAIEIDWLPTFALEPGAMMVFLPLWPIVLVSCGLTFLAFHRARRLRAANSCRVCHYPRAGLPEAAPCPECGKA